MLAGDLLCLGKLPGTHAGCADIAYFAGTDEIVQGLHRFLDRSRWIPAVYLVEIDIVGSQPFQRCIHSGEDMFSGQTAGVRRNGRCIGGSRVCRNIVRNMEINFRGDDDFITFGVFFQQFAGQDFGQTVGIQIGRIEKIDARFNGALDERTRSRAIQNPWPPFG